MSDINIRETLTDNPRSHRQDRNFDQLVTVNLVMGVSLNVPLISPLIFSLENLQ